MINCRQPKHVPTLNEGRMLGCDVPCNDPPFDAVGQPTRIETVLQLPMKRSIQLAHERCPVVNNQLCSIMLCRCLEPTDAAAMPAMLRASSWWGRTARDRSFGRHQ